MVKVVKAIFIGLALIELATGLYFATGYINAWRVGVTTLGPAWNQLTTYWLITGILSLIIGIITLVLAIRSWKRKQINMVGLLVQILLGLLYFYFFSELLFGVTIIKD